MLKKNRYIWFFVFVVVSVLIVFIVVISTDMACLRRIARKNNLRQPTWNNLRYKLYFLNMPVGYLNVETRKMPQPDQNRYSADLWIRPVYLLRIISADNLGVNFKTILDQETFLPYVFSQNSLYHIKKAKPPKEILYNHDEWMMQRKGNVEDIEEDTRDFASTLLWLMSQDYKKKPLVETTLNINRTLYLLVGKVTDPSPAQRALFKANLVKLNLKVLKLNKKFETVNAFGMTFYLLKQDQLYIPLLFHLVKGAISFKAVLY